MRNTTALDAQLCTLLLNENRLTNTDIIASVAAKAPDLDTLKDHLKEIIHTLEGQHTSLESLLNDSGVSLTQLATMVTNVHSLLAERIGEDDLRQQLDTAAFKKLCPDVYQKITTIINYPEETAWLRTVEQNLLKELGVSTVSSTSRVKSVASAWEKSGKNLEKLTQLHDLYGIRFVVNTKEDCYKAISNLLVSKEFNAFHYRDYVAKAKASGYSSLHIVIDIPPKRVEVQVRTTEMDHEAKYGAAAHWAYKSDTKHEPSWLKHVLDQNSSTNKVRVYTPAGQALLFEQGACVIDFAYEVHSDIGKSCVGATINGQAVALDTILTDGDTVSVRTGKREGPNKDWLNWVVSSKAKIKIRRQLKEHTQPVTEPVQHTIPQPQPVRPKLTQPLTDSYQPKKVEIIGAEGLAYRLGQCCHPHAGDPIVARVLRDGTFNVHRQTCVNVSNALNVVEAKWT